MQFRQIFCDLESLQINIIGMNQMILVFFQYSQLLTIIFTILKLRIKQTTMANTQSSPRNNQQPRSIRSNSTGINYTYSSNKLIITFPITSQDQQEYMEQILLKRPLKLDSEFICTVRKHQFLQNSFQAPCVMNRQLRVYFDAFEYRLCDIPIEQYTVKFSKSDVYLMIHCVAQALLVYRRNRTHHGDIFMDNICYKSSGVWQLLDKRFVKNGIDAYENVLEGEEGFISPQHMERIRHGFIRISPEVEESDDIFALGMLALQMASARLSRNCYRESFVRLDEAKLTEHLNLVAQRHEHQLSNLITDMLEIDETDRIDLDHICRHPKVASCRKTSLRASNCSHRNQIKGYFSNNQQQQLKSQSIIKRSRGPSRAVSNDTKFKSFKGGDNQHSLVKYSQISNQYGLKNHKQLRYQVSGNKTYQMPNIAVKKPYSANYKPHNPTIQFSSNMSYNTYLLPVQSSTQLRSINQISRNNYNQYFIPQNLQKPMMQSQQPVSFNYYPQI